MKHLFTLLATLFAAVAAWSQIQVPNGDCETLDAQSTTGAAAWKVGGTATTCMPEPHESPNGKWALKLTRTTPAGQGEFKQEFPFRSTTLSKYKIRCTMKATNLKGRAGIGARIFDGDDSTICGYFAVAITQNQDWKTIEGEFYANTTVAKMRLFCVIEGEGEVGVDDVAIEQIPSVKARLKKSIGKYIDEYFRLVRRYGIMRDTVRIDRLEAETRQLCEGAKDLAYCHNILKRYTTLNLLDGHSFFWTPAEWKDYNKGSGKVTLSGLVNFPTGHLDSQGIGQIKVPLFASLDPGILQQYVDSLQRILRACDTPELRGWILDLSENQGGNAFAMLTALGPLLGEGVCGYSRSADGSQRTRIYQHGATYWDQNLVLRQESPVYALKHGKDLPVAVIYSSQTGSAGEVVAISFRGLPNSRSFGEPTAGATTRVDNLQMRDGATLNLACGWDVDRNGITYTGPIPPDEQSENHEQALKAAANWILTRNQ